MPKSHSLEINGEPGGTTQKGNKDTSHRTIKAGNIKGKMVNQESIATHQKQNLPGKAKLALRISV